MQYCMRYLIQCHWSKGWLGGSYLYCVLDLYTQRTRAWQGNWQPTYLIFQRRFVQDTPVWHITKKAGNQIPSPG